MLDAGTGLNSIQWIAQLPTDRWTAVTGTENEAERVRVAIGDLSRDCDEIILGNWANADLLRGEVFDTVLADYLAGAIEGHAPFFQPYLFNRLRPLTKQVLYVTGLEPYVPKPAPDEVGARTIWEIGRLRDACVLLAGDVPYREYPAGWVVDQLQRSKFEVQSVKHFKIGYKATFVNAQINIGLHAIDKLKDASLGASLKRRCEYLRERALSLIQSDGALRGCRNYVISAKPS